MLKYLCCTVFFYKFANEFKKVWIDSKKERFGITNANIKNDV